MIRRIYTKYGELKFNGTSPLVGHFEKGRKRIEKILEGKKMKYRGEREK